MAANIVLTYAMLFGAVIALICAVYVYKINKAKIAKRASEQKTVSE